MVEPTEEETVLICLRRLKRNNLKDQMMTFLRSIVARAVEDLVKMHQELEEVFRHSRSRRNWEGTQS